MLLPRPTSLEFDDGDFLLDETTRIGANAPLDSVAVWLQGVLRPSTGLPLHMWRPSETGSLAITLELALDLRPEAFRLVVEPTGIRISGGTAAGVFYGCQALLQLLPSQVYRKAKVSGVEWRIPAIRVEDAPRFVWRGVMLDVARHFMPKHDLLRFIDLMAMHRLNVLHLHLTDDQGWRVEIKRYPLLTEVGSSRKQSQRGAQRDAESDGRPHGGFYTQEDIREIVAYARERYISVVPEVEMPGHVQAALAAYPELGVTTESLEVWTRWGVNYHVLNIEESTIEFFKNVIDEVIELFPSTYIGVGGDECPKDEWREDARTQERMRELGLADENAVQSWFIGQLDAHLTAKGRRLFGWDEILEGGLAPGATVASWRGFAGAIAAARLGHDVVVCPDTATYFDYRQSENPDEPIPVGIPLSTRDVYAFNPVPADLTEAEASHILGGQGNIWTEHMDSPRTIDYFAFPRLCALAEVLWASGERDYDEFAGRLDLQTARLAEVGVEFRHGRGPTPWQMRPGVRGRPQSRQEREAHIAGLTKNIGD